MCENAAKDKRPTWPATKGMPHPTRQSKHRHQQWKNCAANRSIRKKESNQRLRQKVTSYAAKDKRKPPKLAQQPTACKKKCRIWTRTTALTSLSRCLILSRCLFDPHALWASTLELACPFRGIFRASFFFSMILAWISKSTFTFWSLISMLALFRASISFLLRSMTLLTSLQPWFFSSKSS